MRREYLFGLLFLAVITLSCKKDSLENVQQSSENKERSEGFVEGRFHFSSRESLIKTIEEMRNDEKLLGKTMKKLYLEGFRSKSPIGNVETDMELIQLFNNSLVEREFQEENVNEETLRADLEEESLIADPVLSAFVNQKNEIVINDSLFKFTRIGIFSSKLKDKSKLFSYLEELDQDLSEEEILQLRKNSFGNMLVAEGVKRYIAPLSEEILEQKLVKRTPEVNLQPIIDGLPITAGGKNWIFQRIFGESIVSEEYFDRRRRAKVEFWNQNYGFYKSTGRCFCTKPNSSFSCVVGF